MKFELLIGRILFSSIFLISVPQLFTRGSVQYAASEGVPWASVLVPIAGVLALLGGLSVLLGFKARWGAWLLVLFLVPVSVMMHAFWAVKDPTMAQMQQIHFMKNMTMLGGALLVVYFGSGPVSVDAWLGARRSAAPAKAPA